MSVRKIAIVKRQRIRRKKKLVYKREQSLKQYKIPAIKNIDVEDIKREFEKKKTSAFIDHNEHFLSRLEKSLALYPNKRYKEFLHGNVNPKIYKEFVPKSLDIFSDVDSVLDWLIQPLKSLNYNTPISYLTKNKVQPVLDELTRIEYGDYN